MSSSKRERYDRKEGKDNLRVDAYDPQIDPDLYDGYKFHSSRVTSRRIEKPASGTNGQTKRAI